MSHKSDMAGPFNRDDTIQGSNRLQKYLNLEGFLEKSLKIKSASKSTGNHPKVKSLNSTIFYRISHCR